MDYLLGLVVVTLPCGDHTVFLLSMLGWRNCHLARYILSRSSHDRKKKVMLACCLAGWLPLLFYSDVRYTRPPTHAFPLVFGSA